jgi:hypothetical protein
MILRVAKPKHPAEVKREDLRNQLFPGSANEIYDRNVHDGYSTVPRTIGLMLTLLEKLAEKGKNVARVYSELWFRTPDCKLIEIEDELDVAYASGLSVRRWKERIDILAQLGFIRIAPNGSRRYGYIFLPNPNEIVIRMRRSGQISDELWGAFTKRCSKIGYKIVLEQGAPPTGQLPASSEHTAAQGDQGAAPPQQVAS